MEVEDAEPRGRWRALRPRWIVLALLALPVMLLLVRRGDEARQVPAGIEALPVIDFAHLEAVQGGFQTRLLPKSERQLDDVLAYWWSANAGLFSRLASLVGRMAEEPPPLPLTCILAAGGGGEHVHRLLQLQGGARVRRVDVGELLRRDRYLRRVLDVEERPALSTLEGKVLARLPAFGAHQALDARTLSALIHGSDQPRLPPDSVVVLEGLETLHADASAALLRLIREGAGDAGGLTRTHFVVLGPSAAFASWLETLPPKTAPPLESLAPPRVGTSGDLAYLVQATLALERERWPEELEIESFQGLVLRHAFLRTCLGHAFLWRQLAENSVSLAGRGERQVQDWLYRRLLDRAGRELGRDPSPDGVPARGLEEAAARFAERVGADGWFEVGGDETLAVETGESNVHLSARGLLEQSGCVERDLTAPGRYRFEPFWLHAYLARARLGRVRPADEDAGKQDPPLARKDRGWEGGTSRVQAILAGDVLHPSAEQLGRPRVRLPRPPR